MDPVTWLRKEIKRDFDTANLISAGGFVPQRWDTEPPGQVNPDEIPASRQVTDAIGASHDEVCGWVQLVAYDRTNIEPPEADSRDSTCPVILVDNGRREFEHIIRHDPRNVVADCEAKLAILDEHAPADFAAYGERLCRRCRWDEDEPERDDDAHHWVVYPCRTVRLLLGAYKHRTGFEEKWLAASG